MLVRGLPADDGGGVVRAHAGREPRVALEVLLELSGVHACGGAAGTLLGAVAEHLGPLAVEVDQFLRHHLPLGRIGMQQPGCALLGQHGREFPSQVERVLHGKIHALPGLGAVGVAGIAGDEHAWQRRPDRLRRHVVVLVADALADLVHRPPGDLLHVQRVRVQDALRRGDELVDGDVPVGDPLLVAQFFHLHIEAHQIAALARDHQQVAAGGLYRRLVADIRKVGHGQQVHHAPGLVGGVAHQLAADGFAHHATGAVAADNIAGLHAFHLARMGRVRSFHPHRDRVIGRSAVHHNIPQATGIMRLQPTG